MIYNSWTVQPNILMRLSSVPHECWGCIDTFLGFLRTFNVNFVHGGTWHIMVGATFEGMFYMHGICLDMLTPMLHIFVWPKRWGAIRAKGFARVPIVEFKALD